MPNADPQPMVQVIIPARNEEENIGRCLDSLVSQQGIAFQITVVDDGSTDRTRAIAEAFSEVMVISAGDLPAGTMGKCNALIRGAQGATAKWLLFTDADTFHYPGSLAAAVSEAESRAVDLLSYSPEQETVGWIEKALLPLVFADLARVYPPARVNDPADPTVAANGQYILVRREAYEKLGGHCAVADKLLEDVELARLFKSSGHKIWFRHGAGLVRTRMYRTAAALFEGWTKNLALLFRYPVSLAFAHILTFAVVLLGLTLGCMFFKRGNISLGSLVSLTAVLFYLYFLKRLQPAHFPWKANLLAFFGLPIFAWLLVRSSNHHARGEATWKGRVYRHLQPSTRYPETSKGVNSSIQRWDSNAKS